MALAWYVARTSPRAEFVARDQLESKGFEYYLPVISTESPRRRSTDAPLFPSYLFLRYDTESPESISLRTMQGLTGLVNFDGVAPPIPDEVIFCLRQRIAEMNESGGLCSRFRPGEQVWIRWGAGESEDLAEVVTDTRSPQARVRVLIEFLGRLVHGEVHRANIRPVHEDEVSRNEHRGRFPRRTRGKGRYVSGVGAGPSHNERAST